MKVHLLVLLCELFITAQTRITLKNRFAFADMYNDDKQLTFQDPSFEVNEKH
jgi:hypothetical protein